MRKSFLLSFLLLLIFAPVVTGQSSEFPKCSQTEILLMMNSLLDFDSDAGPPGATLDDLIADGRSQLEKRESSFSLLPLCAEAIGTQRQDIMLEGDLVGYNALRLASLSDDENPYFIRGRIDEKRLAELSLGLLSGDTEEEGSPDDGGIVFCSREENQKLDQLVSDFQATQSKLDDGQDREQLINSLDNMLVWREDKMLQLPQCAQAIELAYLLNKLATDSAAMFAFSYAGVSTENNPYAESVTLAMGSLATWRDELRLTRPEYEGATVLVLGQGSELPPCSSAEIAAAYSVILDEIMEVVMSAQSVEAAADLIAYGDAHISLRDGSLAQLPLCQEIFEVAWLSRQILGDNIAWFALNLFGFTVEQNPFSSQADEKMQGVVAWLEAREEHLAGVEGIAGPASDEREVSVCSDDEVLYVIGYLLPGYRSFIDEAFSMETVADLYALYDHSFAFRDRLWRELPRCQQVLEIGMLMRQVAADWVTLMSLDASQSPLERNPYLLELKRDMALVTELRQSLITRSIGAGNAEVDGTTYYVTANPYANIRSCASTNCSVVTTAQNGEALTVIDDSKDWYEIRLENGESAFIAGFLMSKNPPGN